MDTKLFCWLLFFSLFFSGILLLALGIVGVYIAKIYSESKHRPVYIIREWLSFDKEDIIS